MDLKYKCKTLHYITADLLAILCILFGRLSVPESLLHTHSQLLLIKASKKCPFAIWRITNKTTNKNHQLLVIGSSVFSRVHYLSFSSLSHIRLRLGFLVGKGVLGARFDSFF